MGFHDARQGRHHGGTQQPCRPLAARFLKAPPRPPPRWHTTWQQRQPAASPAAGPATRPAAGTVDARGGPRASETRSSEVAERSPREKFG